MTMQAFKLLGAAVMASALCACGSSGGAGDTGASATPITPPVTPPSTDNALAIASPSLAVVTGQASKSINLTGCLRVADSQPVSSTTLVINANGDMIFSGSTQAAPVVQLARLNLADTNQRQLLLRAAAASIQADLAIFTPSQRIDLSLIDTPKFVYSAPIVQIYKCDPGPSTADFKIEQLLTSTRIVNTIVTGSTSAPTLTPVGSTTADYTQTGSIVSWDTGATGTFARFASFNLDTAQLGEGPSLSASSHTPVAYNLPSSGSSVRAQYVELLNPSGTKQISFEYDNIKFCYAQLANNARDFKFAKSPASLRCQ